MRQALRLVSFPLVLLVALLVFLLLGECESPAEAAPAAAQAGGPPAAPAEDETYVVNELGELCRLCWPSTTRPRVERPCSGRFTATGKLLVRQ